MHVDFTTTYGFTWPINQIFKPCVTSEQETLHCCVVVPFIQRVPRWALLRRRRQPTVTKGVKGLARWRTAFSAPSCNGRIRASEEGRNHAKRARKKSAASEPPKSPSTSLRAAVQCCLEAGSGTERTSRASKSEESENSRFVRSWIG